MSMGWSAARKLRRAVDGLTRVIAIELLTAARSLDLRRPLDARPGDGGGPRRAARDRRPAPARTGTSGRRSTPRSTSSRPGAALAAAESVVGPLS